MKHVLEFEFFEEEGSGLGPTLEYFSLVTQELIKLDKLLWRKSEDGSLFPCPIPSQNCQFLKKQTKEVNKVETRLQIDKMQSMFRMLGSLIGRAILDERLIDLPINSLFWDLILDRVVIYFLLVFIMLWFSQFSSEISKKLTISLAKHCLDYKI